MNEQAVSVARWFNFQNESKFIAYFEKCCNGEQYRGGDYNKQSLDSLWSDHDYRDKRLKQITQTGRLVLISCYHEKTEYNNLSLRNTHFF